MKYVGAVVLATYSRTDLFEKSIKSIYQAFRQENYIKIIIIQKGFPDATEIIRPFLDENTSVIMVEGSSRTPLQNICFNYLLALEMAFDKFNCDWVLELEDDTVVSEDVFILIEDVMSLFFSNPRFRGINLGSTNKDTSLQDSFSMLRNSFHASQGVITRASWKRISSKNIRRKLGVLPMDWSIESYWKTGFVATPNISRCMNFGWQNGTHVSNDANQKLFLDLNSSWELHKPQMSFHLDTVPHFWNEEIRPYSSAENGRFDGLYLWSKFTQSLFYLNMHKRARNLKRFFLNRPHV